MKNFENFIPVIKEDVEKVLTGLVQPKQDETLNNVIHHVTLELNCQVDVTPVFEYITERLINKTALTQLEVLNFLCDA